VGVVVLKENKSRHENPDVEFTYCKLAH